MDIAASICMRKYKGEDYDDDYDDNTDKFEFVLTVHTALLYAQ